MRKSATRLLVLGYCVLACRLAAAPQTSSLPVLTYRFERAPANVQELTSRFSSEQIIVLEALNRADATHLSTLKTLVVPDSWQEDVRAYSPFPLHNAAWGSNLSKVLIVHQPAQAFAAYEHGLLVRWGPISTGRQSSQTPEGLFHLNWRSPGRHSTVNPNWFLPWYFNFENERGLSFHEYGLPGRPASHACVRLLERDARWLFEWGEGWTLDDRGWEVLTHGTPVLIVGCYAFDREQPWQAGTRLPGSIDVPVNPYLGVRSCSAAA